MSGRKGSIKKIDSFINQYQLSKTLRFKLIPQGETLANFKKNNILEADKNRADNFNAIRKFADELLHKSFIEKVLSKIKIPLDVLQDYNKNRDDSRMLKTISKTIRENISDHFAADPDYNNLFGERMIANLYQKISDEKQKQVVSYFNSFASYFVKFDKNRKNLYTGAGKATEIAYRIVDQNLPKFLDNIEIWKKISPTVFPEKLLRKINKDLSKLEKGLDVSALFQLNSFNKVLSQSGIDRYNQILGGYSTRDNTKIRGLNEYINKYNQKNKTKHPTLKQLYKQVLSDRGTISYIPPAFISDTELLTAIRTFWNGSEQEEIPATSAIVKQITELFAHIQDYDPAGLFIAARSVTSLSHKVYGSWDVLREGLGKNFSDTKSKSYSLKELQEAGNTAQDDAVSLSEKIKSIASSLKLLLENAYKAAKVLIDNKGDTAVFNGKISAKVKESNITLIREFLDSVKDFQQWAKLLTGTGKESGKDESFYCQFTPLYDTLDAITPLYNKVRNYLTRKPYSTNKIKLNFDYSEFLKGWDKNKEKSSAGIILLKDGYYYLGIIKADNKKHSPLENIPKLTEGESTYKKMVYKQLKSTALNQVFFAEKWRDKFKPSPEIIRIKDEKTYKTDIEALYNLIDFYKKCFEKHEEWEENFHFQFSDTKEYPKIDEFLSDVEDQGYKISFEDISEAYINQMVKDGRLYLFQIYSKDFSSFSKGTPNMHTLYFKALFNKANLKDGIFKLDGGTEMFYREASIPRDVTHPKNQPIGTKNPDNPVKKKTFDYDLIKDKRYTEDQFMLNIPIKLNFKAARKGKFNQKVRDVIREHEKNYVIGIDRGERNLIYVCVINEKGSIVEQFSLNDIVNEYKGGKITTHYHQLLDVKEKDRDDARRNWTTIANIKELKEGYISQVVHKICLLIEKYDAIVAMENLNQGFKRGRQKVEKQVYQKFEKMLIDKLNFYADKKRPTDKNGGILKAYQLTTAFQSFEQMKWQNGFVFYVSPGWTSKIDPVTGFINLLKVKYSSVADSQKFFGAFDRVRFDKKKGYYCFEMDLDKLKDWISAKNLKPQKTRWTVCSYGDRIETFKNKKGQYETRTVTLTEEFNKLFRQYGIDTSAEDLRPAITGQTEKDFFAALSRLLHLTLQIRNSWPGTSEDYLISPVQDDKGNIFDSRKAKGDMPENADANGAYHIARKALWIIDNKIKSKAPAKEIGIKDNEWLDFAQGKRTDALSY